MLTAVVLLAGCSKSIEEGQNSIAVEQLQERNGIYFQANDINPYTWKVTTFYDNGQKKSE
jgi:hypothetical protein